MRYLVYSLSVLLFTINACKTSDKKDVTETENSSTQAIKVGNFSADSAFAFTEKQVSFGPRVPGTAASKKCGDWAIGKFKQYGLKVTEQAFKAVLYNGKTVDSRNIIAAYKPEATKRILLAAHYDSRPFADKDPNKSTKAIDGANDGASGVAVLIELARQLSLDSSGLGVDFILFDTEDWGSPIDFKGEVKHEYGGYCLGSEYWSKNPHVKGYTAYYGVLLDMVGAPGALFRKDAFSMQVAPSVAQNIWSVAASNGYAQYFSNELGGGITDDHVPVTTNAKIPMVDIIDNRPTDNLFFEHHHTSKDNMQTIDKNTLKAVGQTLLHVLTLESTTL
jgi:glutaminyl-peptide cyclotransferase